MSRPTRRDDGFTVIELIVAIGIFSILVIISGAAMITGMRAVHDQTDRQVLQGEEQNAALWLSRLIRNIDNPYDTVPTAPAITFAGFTNGRPTLTFTTFAGIGTVDRVPYKVTIEQTATSIDTVVIAPDMSSGIPVFNAANGQRRSIVTSSTGVTPKLTLKYYTSLGPPPVELTPPANGSLTAAQLATVKAIEFTITGTTQGQAVKQTVVIGNPI